MKTRIQAGIVDDEQDGREYVALLLANEFPELEISLLASGVEEAYNSLVLKQPDILFLDIEMGDGNGFDLLSKMKDLTSRIIFITAYDHYAIQAIRNNAFDYILKPVNKTEFIDAVNKAIEKIKKTKPQYTVSAEYTINLPTQNGFRRTHIADIIRCEAYSNYTLIYLNDKTKVTVSRTLQEFEEQFEKHHFFRVHHKHLINLAHFREYIKGAGGQAVMSDGSAVAVSVRKKNDFLERIRGLG